MKMQLLKSSLDKTASIVSERHEDRLYFSNAIFISIMS